MITNLPKAHNLLSAPFVLTGKDIINNRHLFAAELFDTVELRLHIEYQTHEPEEPDDFDDLMEIRNSKHFGFAGKVTCPGCEEVDDDETCEWCGGNGLVTVEAWDEWLEQEKGCKSYVKGCERGCKRKSCPHDELRCLLDVPVLVLEARKMSGNWTSRGDSVQGFKLKGIVGKPDALRRYLSLVATSIGFGLLDD